MSALERPQAVPGSQPGTPDPRLAEESVLPQELSRWQVAVAGLMFVAGLWCFRFQLYDLWGLWTRDGLRSIGLLIPPASLLLALRAWTREDWQEGGSWWGLLLIGLSLGVGVRAQDSPLYAVITEFSWARINLVPTGLILCTYASGAVLLFGGRRTWIAVRFPLLLLIFVNPVPTAFSALVDLPLQHIAAQAARGFAAVLNVPVSEGTLKMMFAPQLGMFIAPGCDGLRGAATMGYIALIVGHLHRLSAPRLATFAVSASVLAYVFNLLRLCGVVIYYWFALRFPTIGAYGAQVDYAIGGVLFCFAAMFLFGAPLRWVRA